MKIEVTCRKQFAWIASQDPSMMLVEARGRVGLTASCSALCFAVFLATSMGCPSEIRRRGPCFVCERVFGFLLVAWVPWSLPRLLARRRAFHEGSSGELSVTVLGTNIRGTSLLVPCVSTFAGVLPSRAMGRGPRPGDLRNGEACCEAQTTRDAWMKKRPRDGPQVPIATPRKGQKWVDENCVEKSTVESKIEREKISSIFHPVFIRISIRVFIRVFLRAFCVRKRRR